MARGEARQAANLLEVAAQQGRDTATLLRLATVRRSIGDLDGALRAATAAVELSPRDFLLWMLVGSLREATGALHAAQRAYRVAVAEAPPDLSFQPAMQKQLDWARRRAEAMETWRGRLLQWELPEGVSALSPTEEARMRGFRADILENFDAGTSLPFMIPGIEPWRYFDAHAFLGIAELEQATDAICAEFLALAQAKNDRLGSRLGGLHAAQSEGERPGSWSMIPLIRNGVVVEEFASLCPCTMQLARRLDLPRIPLISPSLYFSVLEPNSRIMPHIGITNARVISHLPLIVPDDCGFRVGGETRRWEKGKVLVFDDMTTHEAWNDSNRIRVVLIADLWRPELSPAERAAVTDLMDCPDVLASDQPPNRSR